MSCYTKYAVFGIVKVGKGIELMGVGLVLPDAEDTDDNASEGCEYRDDA